MSLSDELAFTLKSLQALTSGGRMSVLRCLRQRRMTAAEVASALDIQKSSAHKHLLRLSTAGFVKRHDDDRVWVYYSLTREGRHLAETERPRLVLLLGTSLAALAAAATFLYWRVHKWTNTDGQGTWGVDEIFPRPRPEFFTPAVLASIALGVLALLAALHLGWRVAASRRQHASDAIVESSA